MVMTGDWGRHLAFLNKVRAWCSGKWETRPMRLLGKASARNKMISESDLRIMSILALDILSKRNVSTKYTTVRMLLISTSKLIIILHQCVSK
jgi:hypothetical protein